MSGGDEVLAGWSRDVAVLMACGDDPALPMLLDAALARLVSFDLSVAFAYPANRVMCLHDGLRGVSEPMAMHAYLTATHVFDPFCTACRGEIAPGLYRMRELAPDDFFVGDYHGRADVHPCISMQGGTLAEEIGYLFALPSGAMAAYSLMRSHGGATFTPAEVSRLRAVEPVVRQLLVHHWRHVAIGARPGRPHAAGDGPEEEFDGFAPRLLTPRQRLIVQMLTRGHGTASVAAHLGLSVATVKTHRKEIHRRLGISSQSELFAKVTRHLLARPAPGGR